jgi:hypothetical protein
MGVSTDAILFYGYCWHDEAHSLWKTDDDDDDSAEDESDWETRYARSKGLSPPSAPFPERTVTPTRENGWSSTPKDYSAAEQTIIDQYKAYWEAKRKLVETASCLVDSHCAASCPMPYVAVRKSVTSSHRGYPNKITSVDVDPTWNAALAEFCKTLEVKIGNKKPSWWLVSNLGE